jgi:hypothetical protein
MKLCPECEKGNPIAGVKLCADCIRRLNLPPRPLPRSKDFAYPLKERA